VLGLPPAGEVVSASVGGLPRGISPFGCCCGGLDPKRFHLFPSLLLAVMLIGATKMGFSPPGCRVANIPVRESLV
jgi:hypothetical protein